jgi:hypothetical protein
MSPDPKIISPNDRAALSARFFLLFSPTIKEKHRHQR